MSNNVPSVDQSDRLVPINLRQSGPTPVEMLIDTRVRKSPYWHLSAEAGCWRASVYNRMYHPRGYVRPEDGGAMVEYDSIVNHVTLWNVAVERQIQVKGPDAADFVNFVITRDATKIPPMRARYVILCNEAGGILNDPVLLRVAEDEYWFSLSDSDLMFWLQGVNVGRRFDVEINEIDVSPVQIQGPKSVDLMADLFGPDIEELPSYGLYAGSHRRLRGDRLPDRLLRREGLRDLPQGRDAARRDGCGTPCSTRARPHQLAVIAPGPPPPDRRRHPVVGPGHGRRDAAVPGQPRLPGAAHQGGRLHRQGGARGGPRGARGREPAVHPHAGGDATRRASRSTTTRPTSG